MPDVLEQFCLLGREHNHLPGRHGEAEDDRQGASRRQGAGVGLTVRVEVESRIDEVPMEKGINDLYKMSLYSEDNMEMIDTYDLFKQLVSDLFNKVSIDHIVNKVIFSIARATGDYVEKISKKYKNKKVFLSGELFKNPVFLSSITRELEGRGLEVFYNRTIPIDDSGISVGQIINYYYSKNSPRLN